MDGAMEGLPIFLGMILGITLTPGYGTTIIPIGLGADLAGVITILGGVPAMALVPAMLGDMAAGVVMATDIVMAIGMVTGMEAMGTTPIRDVTIVATTTPMDVEEPLPMLLITV